MPTFTAIALDRLLEPGASRSVGKPIPPNSNSASKSLSNSTTHVRNSKPEKGNGKNRPNGDGRSSNSSTEKKFHFAQISPALYATPESTPLPDSPSSGFPPSPYLIIHKRRGPRLLKSFSQNDVASQATLERSSEEKDKRDGENKQVLDSAVSGPVTFTVPSPDVEEHVNGLPDGEHVNGLHGGELESNGVGNGTAGAQELEKLVSPERDGESTDFFDPHESMSYTSNTDGEDNGGAESSLNLTTPMGEFFDASEELSSDSEPRSSLRDVEGELHEIRLSLLMEIEKRKQAEEALNNMRSQWQRIVEQLSAMGLTLPADPAVVSEDNKSGADLAEDLCRQVYLARFVSESVGRGIVKAQMEMEMEAQMETKNFEIARLLDRLRYYEAVNREMSQRNQETVEMARRDRLRRKRRQRWAWGLVAAAITLGTGALAWSFLPAGTGGSHSSNHSQGPEENKIAK